MSRIELNNFFRSSVLNSIFSHTDGAIKLYNPLIRSEIFHSIPTPILETLHEDYTNL